MQSNNNGGHEPPHKANGQQEKEEHQKPLEDDKNNFEFESLSREELIELVKNMKFVAKKEAEESAKLAQELVTLKKALLVSQQKVEVLTSREMANRNAGEEREKLPKSAEEREKVSITTMDLPPSSRVPLPLELNCEIYKCLKLPVQRKFIWGLGRDIYGIFGQKLLKKTKRVRNPHGNYWNGTNSRATIAADGLHVSSKGGYPNVFAEQPFDTSGPLCRMDDFSGTICYYYEVKGPLYMVYVGLTDGVNPDNDNLRIGEYTNSYAIPTGYYNHYCWLAGEVHPFGLPVGAIRPDWEDDGMDVFGCGLVLDPENKLAIFFTMNGKLLGQKIPISPTVDRLFPAVTMTPNVSLSIEANFGDDPQKPFKYDIKNCPGLDLACI